MLSSLKFITGLRSSKPVLGSFVATRSVSILSRLAPSYKSTKKYIRVGRGPSSGKGKTSGRGQKGQKARGKVKPWFEGGQTPIQKLFPKVGFRNSQAPVLKILNLNRIIEFHKDGRLNLKEGEVLDMRRMKKLGLITGTLRDGVKILADGKEKLNFPLKVEATRASTQAIKAIERAGGEFTARYFSRLSLRVHLHPEYFLRTKGYIPLPARPTRKKYIQFYSNPHKRGYLIKENHPYLQVIKAAQNNITTKKVEKKSWLENALQSANDVNNSAIGFSGSGVVKASDLKNLKL